MLFDLKQIIICTVRLSIVNIAMWIGAWFLSLVMTHPAIFMIPAAITTGSIVVWGYVVSLSVAFKD
jgi:hypothetical protein